MRTFYSLILLLLSLTTSGQPPVYFDFLSHNEETGQWNNPPFYTLNRSKVVNLSAYFQSNGITWNLQSDWVYLVNVLTQDSAFISGTNNKNILRFLHEDRGVEIDPHAHESQYIYPDVVKLMDSVGLPESKVIGGTIYNDSNGVNVWTNLVNGQYGIIFPGRFWQPDYMMGGGTPNHVADLKYYGFWNPQDTANYLTHDSTSHLRHIGVGCEMKIRDTTTIAWFVEQLKDVVQKVQSGQYPANGFYMQTIFFEQAELNSQAFYNKVIQIADSVNYMVASGAAQWKTLKQAYTLWDSVYQAQVFQWECGVVTTAMKDMDESRFSIFPNPAIHNFHVQLSQPGRYVFSIYDVLGVQMLNTELSGSDNEIKISGWPAGIYLCRIEDENGKITLVKLQVN